MHLEANVDLWRLYVSCREVVVQGSPSLFMKFFHQLFFIATTSVFGLHHPYILLVVAENIFRTIGCELSNGVVLVARNNVVAKIPYSPVFVSYSA